MILSTTDQDTFWMQHALKLAHQAEMQDEVPVGAVLIHNNILIAEGWNCSIGEIDPSAHAEMVALRRAASTLNNYRLTNTTLYVTLEPCAMCAGAMVQARIARLVYGAYDPRAGAVTSVFNILQEPRLNHRVTHQGGVLAEECGGILKDFFKKRRNV
ncbi:tRNA adenosine(34) deaminase TadA [soil metagenome]